MEEITVEGRKIKISHPGKMLWPEAEITKLDYIRYLLTVAPHMIPYTRDRMLMIWLYPHGVQGKKIEKRSVPQSAPDWLPKTEYKEKKRMLLNNQAALLWAANYGGMEFHVPFDRYTKENFPTELAFDLDPPDGQHFERVSKVALKLREILESLGLHSVAKTSGKTGLQVHVPIVAKYTFQSTRAINRFIAEYMLEKMPEQVTLERRVKKREDKLYFDYLQLWAGRTMPAPYSVRATAQATVSTPVTWKEIESGIHPSDFTILSVPSRLKKMGDLFRTVSARNDKQNIDHILSFINKKIPSS
ncbi:MAG TPA: non-homologous end-joining DNA ligase [Bacillales bacterium]|nr:non-homologous end-joining DNA ligase [Bacillales bacterium]